MPICINCKYHSFKTYYHDPYFNKRMERPEDFYTKEYTYGYNYITCLPRKKLFWREKQDHFCSFIYEHIDPITGEKTTYTNLLCISCNRNGQCTKFENKSDKGQLSQTCPWE